LVDGKGDNFPFEIIIFGFKAIRNVSSLACRFLARLRDSLCLRNLLGNDSSRVADIEANNLSPVDDNGDNGRAAEFGIDVTV
jgi:hypothetical protein